MGLYTVQCASSTEDIPLLYVPHLPTKVFQAPRAAAEDTGGLLSGSEPEPDGGALRSLEKFSRCTAISELDGSLRILVKYPATMSSNIGWR